MHHRQHEGLAPLTVRRVHAKKVSEAVTQQIPGI